QSMGERRTPADPALAGIGLVFADQRHYAFDIVLVDDRHRRAEIDTAAVDLHRRVDDLGGLHPPGQMRQFAVDLAQLLAAVNIVAILGTVAIAGGPADH